MCKTAYKLYKFSECKFTLNGEESAIGISSWQCACFAGTCLPAQSLRLNCMYCREGMFCAPGMLADIHPNLQIKLEAEEDAEDELCSNAISTRIIASHQPECLTSSHSDCCLRLDCSQDSADQR